MLTVRRMDRSSHRRCWTKGSAASNQAALYTQAALVHPMAPPLQHCLHICTIHTLSSPTNDTTSVIATSPTFFDNARVQLHLLPAAKCRCCSSCRNCTHEAAPLPGGRHDAQRLHLPLCNRLHGAPIRCRQHHPPASRCVCMLRLKVPTASPGSMHL